MRLRFVGLCWVVAVLTAIGPVCRAQVTASDIDGSVPLSEVERGARAAQPAIPSGYGPHAPAARGVAGPPPPAAESTPLGRPRPLPTTRTPPDAEQAPLKPNAANRATGGVIWPLAGVLALVVIAGTAVRVLARRGGGLGGAMGAGGRSPAGLLEVLGRYPLGRGTSLVLLKLDRRVLLLSRSAGGRLGAGAGFTTLCEISDPEEVASILVKTRDAEGDSMAERFRALLTRFDGDMGDAAPDGPSSRRVVGSASGDRAELWDERQARIPVVDLTLQPETGGSVSLLRKRLASMGGRGAA